ncbi:MAG: sigma-54-dependent Fis family transcriptional regulator [Desulfobulbaceae bacterium]|nr:MAG: sigma-54-dependent Fis family transcriptional regulator [Desulfobulbaceae bacterium]
MSKIADRRLLIIDDEENMRHMLQALVSRHGYQVETAAGVEEALAAIGNRHFDFILCDVRMPGMDGMDFLAKGIDRLQDTTVIMMSAFGSIDTAIEAMKAGAYDFISKPFKADEVIMALRKAEEREALRRENRRLKQEISEIRGAGGFSRIITNNPEMLSLIGLAGKVARYDSTVLITGESGTGKELVARGIHDASLRSEKPFIAVNCGGIPETLLESELFGFVKGAFTGADRNRKGLFEEAEGGTLFLDEVGELPLPLQVKLLRVLQEREIRPLGTAVSRKIDVRILGATARDLAEEVGQGRFREDLFFRLNVIHLQIPPLRRRQTDISLLCQHFLDKLDREMGVGRRMLSPEVMALFDQYAWPGNVRELENIIHRCAVIADDQLIRVEHLPQHLQGDASRAHDQHDGCGLSLKRAQEAVERKYIADALRETGGNRLQASKILEMSYPSLLSKIKKYGLSS